MTECEIRRATCENSQPAITDIWTHVLLPCIICISHSTQSFFFPRVSFMWTMLPSRNIVVNLSRLKYKCSPFIRSKMAEESGGQEPGCNERDGLLHTQQQPGCSVI